MPRNSDFPDYKGISVNHVNDWNAIDYHKPKSTEPKENVSRVPPGPMKGVVKAPKKGSTDTKSLYEKPRDPSLERAANQEWRSRGITNSEIIDH
jgi:hypothetical protein